MDRREFLDSLLAANNLEFVERILSEYTVDKKDTVNFIPIGGRPNNRGAIEIGSDPGRCLIERVTNAHDAILELEYQKRGGVPKCRSPREAASAWLGVPEKEGLSALTNKQRQDLALSTIVRLEPGDGSQSRLISVIDQGIGVAPRNLEATILSLNESNKIQKHFLAGTYGQGGSSTLAFCRYVVIASRLFGSKLIGFTLVRYEDLPAEEYKTGRYVYLVENDLPLSVEARDEDLPNGTIVRHFGYDLSRYTSPLGPRSLYGILGRILFDPVASIRLENHVHNWNRTIKGARNALNGAVDDGDEDSKGPTLDHHVSMFNISLGDHGVIGIEYWILTKLESKNGKKRNRTKPADNFVDATKPIVLTHNGQNHGEISGRTIRDDADLPYLQTQGRIICHVNCDRLSPNAKRLLFSSTREQSREGFMLERIRVELVGALGADDELVRLNEDAREQSLKEKDEDSKRKMRRQVAKLLRIAGAALEEVGGSRGDGDANRDVNPPPSPVKPVPITPSEPPTFIRIKWDGKRDIPFYAGQRRYIRVETDANSDYHDADDPTNSRLNIAVGDDLSVFGTSPLKGGRMRVGIECSESVAISSTGSIRVELYRKGLPALSDEREYVIVESPEPKEKDRKSNLPDFEVIPVSGPEDDDWEFVCDVRNDDDIKRHASNWMMNAGRLHVYYSEAFPSFSSEFRRLEQRDPTIVASFRSRFETWLAVHALLMHQETQSQQVPGAEESALAEVHRQERCRYATMAAMMAAQEVKSGTVFDEEDSP